MLRRSLLRGARAAAGSPAPSRGLALQAAELSHRALEPGAESSKGARQRRDALFDRIARKLSDLQMGPVPMDAVLVTTDFLEGLGMSAERALSCVARHPLMIHYKVEMMEEKVKGLRELGLSPSMVEIVVGRHPNIIGVKTDTIREVRDWYVSLGVSPKKVPFLITVFPQATCLSIQDNLNPKLEILRSAGLSSEHLARILQRTPQVLTLGVDRMHSQIAHIKRYGLSQDEMVKWLTLVPESLNISTKNIDAKIKLLDEMLGPGAGVQALGVQARILMRNPEELRRSFEYLTEVVGIEADRIRRNVALIMRTVERILKPRFEFLVEIDEFSLEASVWWITCPDTQFIDKYPEYKAFLESYRIR